MVRIVARVRVRVKDRAMVRLTYKNADDKGDNDSSYCLYTTLKHGVTLEHPSQIRPTSRVKRMVFENNHGYHE